MLRYAIEKFSETKRKKYLQGKILEVYMEKRISISSGTIWEAKLVIPEQ